MTACSRFFFPGRFSRNNLNIPTPTPVSSGWSTPAIDGNGIKKPVLGISNSNNAAAIKSDGTLWTWGNNTFGFLGNNTAAYGASSPVQTISGGSNWCTLAVSSVQAAIAAIKTDGTLWTWGFALLGGRNSTLHASSPSQTVAGGNNWCQVSMGQNHAGAIKTDGTLWLWGSSNYGQLGNISIAGASSPVQTIGGANNWRFISTGRQISGAIKTDGTLWTWGYNNVGQLGTGAVLDGISIYSSPIQTVAGGTNWSFSSQVNIIDNDFREMAGDGCSGNSRFAVKSDGTLWAWGYNGNFNTLGRLGVGSTVPRVSSPAQVIGSPTNWIKVDTFCGHTIGLKSDGTLWTWGLNGCGGLGNNTSRSFGEPYTLNARSSPGQTIAGGTNWCSITTSGITSAALKTDGTLWVWGSGLCGVLGNNSTASVSSPIQTVAGGTNWKKIALSKAVPYASTLAAIKTDGTLWMWGYGGRGVLGNNSTVNISSPIQTVTGGTNWLHASVGVSVVAIKTDGLWAWGNTYLSGANPVLASQVSSPVQFNTSTAWRQVETSGASSYAVTNTGQLWGWGSIPSNIYSKLTQFGGPTARICSPVQLSTSSTWRQISAIGIGIQCVGSESRLFNWGSAYQGQMGNNRGAECVLHASSPVQTIAGGNNWRHVSAGYNLMAATKTDGTLWTWGQNFAGALGDGTLSNRSSPGQTILGGTCWREAAATNCNHLRFIRCDGVVFGSGTGTLFSFIGTSNTPTGGTRCETTPLQLTLPTTADTITGVTNGQAFIGTNGCLYTWGSTVCGVLGNGQACEDLPVVNVNFDDIFIRRECFQQGNLWGWGNFPFQFLIGDGTSVCRRSSPVQVLGNNWRAVSTAYRLGHSGSSAGIKADGTLWTWGASDCGALGNNLTVCQSSPVQTVTGGNNWSVVCNGYRHMVAVKTDGTLWTWGNGVDGRLGNNSTLSRSSPATITGGGSGWLTAGVTRDASFGITTNGTLWSWGKNYSGVLGVGDIVDRSSPVQIPGTNWVRIFSNSSIGPVGALKADGTLWVWGSNYCGALGTGTVISHSSPVQTVAGGNNWKCAGFGFGVGAAVKSDGTLWTWGRNNYGQLGMFTASWPVSSPVQTVAGGNNWRSVAVTSRAWIANKTDGTVWGSGFLLRGDNTGAYCFSSPVQMLSGTSGWVSVSLSEGTGAIPHTVLAIKE